MQLYVHFVRYYYVMEVNVSFTWRFVLLQGVGEGEGEGEMEGEGRQSELSAEVRV